GLFFQAEDGIRDATVTGVQTCALPISWPPPAGAHPRSGSGGRCRLELAWQAWRSRKADRSTLLICSQILGSRSPNGSSSVSGRRSEERRVGKECRGRAKWGGGERRSVR